MALKICFKWMPCTTTTTLSNKAATIKLIVSHGFEMVKPTLPPGKNKWWPPKKRTSNLSEIKVFYHGPPINIVKHGFITFNMVNICVQKKNPNFAIPVFTKIVIRAKISRFTVDVSENMFFLFLKIRRKPTSPAMRNNEFISRSLTSKRVWYNGDILHLYVKIFGYFLCAYARISLEVFPLLH